MSAPRLSRLYPTAFVTGASTGLGLAFTRMLLAEGVQVWGTSRHPARLPVQEGFAPLALDLGDGPGAEQVFRQAEKAAGGFELVVNNAGYGVFGGFVQTDFAVWQAQLEAMLVNTARLSQVALAGLLTRGRGALVNVSSLAGEFAMPFQSAYNVAKAGLSALNESLMYETQGTGVIVIDFRPGDYNTDFDGSVRRPPQTGLPEVDAAGGLRQARAWAASGKMMREGPPPAHAAATLRRALARGRSGTVRTGRFFQAVLAPLLARFGSLSLRRRLQEKYFDL